METKQDKKLNVPLCYGIDLYTEKRAAAVSTTSTTDNEVGQILGSNTSQSAESKTPQEQSTPRESIIPVLKKTAFSIFSCEIFPKKSQLLQSKSVLMVLINDLDEFYIQILEDQVEFFVEQDLKMKEMCNEIKKKKPIKSLFKFHFINFYWFSFLIDFIS